MIPELPGFDACRATGAFGARVLKEKLGDDGLSGLQSFVDEAGRKWKEDVLTVAAERFDRRLGEEIGALRLDLAKEFGAVRVDTAKEFAAIRIELVDERAGLLKWCFLFWIGQFAAISGMMAFLLRTIGTR